MNDVQDIDLEKRIARFIADRLAVTDPNERPLLRLMVAHEAAHEIILRAKQRGTPLESLGATLARVESADYEI